MQVCGILAQCMTLSEDIETIEARINWVNSHLSLLESDKITGLNTFLADFLDWYSENEL